MAGKDRLRVQFRQRVKHRGPEKGAGDATIRVCRGRLAGGRRPLTSWASRSEKPSRRSSSAWSPAINSATSRRRGCSKATSRRRWSRSPAQFGEPYDPGGSGTALDDGAGELNIPSEGRIAAAKLLVRAYARQVADGRAAAAARRQQDRRPAPADRAGRAATAGAQGDCIGAAGILALFYAHDGRGYLNPCESERIDKAIMDECHRLAVEQPA